MTQCNATAKHSGERCKQPTCNGTTKCRYHGGKSKRGRESATFKHGRYSKAMPQKLMRAHDVMQDDPDYLDIRRIAAMRQVFILERLESLDEAPEAKGVWDSATRVLGALEVAYLATDSDGMKTGLRKMRAIFTERNRYHTTRNEIEGALNDQRKDITDLAAIEYRGESAVPVAQLMTFMGGVMHLIGAVITDDNQRRDMKDGIDKLLNIPETIVGGGQD